MPDDKALETFIEAFDRADVEHKFEDDPTWNDLLKQAERFGKNIEETMNNFFRGKTKVAKANKVLVPSNLQAAYIEPKEVSPLYNVSTDEQKPHWQKTKNLLHNTSVGIEDWDLKLTVKDDDRRYSILLGEHAGVEIKFDTDSWMKKRLNLDYNTQNAKLRAKYTINTPVNGFSTTVYTQRGNVGGSVTFTQKPQNFSTSISADNKNIAGSISYNKKVSKEYTAKWSLYSNYSFKHKEDNVIGISMRLVHSSW